MFLVVEGLQYITVPRCLAFFFLRVGSPIYTHRWEEGKNFGTRIWDKVRCYWEHYGELEEHYWERMGEHDGNTIIKISTSQQITPLPPTPPWPWKGKKWTLLSVCSVVSYICCMHILFADLVATIFLTQLIPPSYKAHIIPILIWGLSHTWNELSQEPNTKDLIV